MFCNKSSRRFRPALEALEDRLVPSTFTVTTTLDVVKAGDHKLSLRKAISRANHHAGPDIIVLPGGVFKMALAGAGDDANLSGDFDITGSVTIQGAGASATFVDAQKLDRVFDIRGGASLKQVTLQGLTVRNGKTGGGGGISVGNTDLRLLDSVVSDNGAAGTGGGLSDFSDAAISNVTLIRSSVIRNASNNSGGGIYLRAGGKLALSRCAVRRNLGASVGGGIFAFQNFGDTATLTSSTVRGNTARFGGGIFAAAVTLTSSNVNGNSGGGIWAVTTATLTDSTVSENSGSANSGGGILADTVTLSRSTVSGNSSSGNGGGIWIATKATLSRSTVSGNRALGGGGIAGQSDTTTVTLTNCTVSGNFASGSGGGIDIGTATLSRSIVRGNTSPAATAAASTPSVRRP